MQGFVLHSKTSLHEKALSNDFSEYRWYYIHFVKQELTVLIKHIILAIPLFLLIQIEVLAQSDYVIESKQRKILFKSENINLKLTPSVIHFLDGVRYVPELPPQSGSSFFSGYERTALGYGYALTLSYDFLRINGLRLGTGIGFRSRSEFYSAVKDSLQYIRPGSQVLRYRRTLDIVDLVVNVGYCFKERIVVTGTLSIASASRTRVTSPDTLARFVGEWKAFSMNRTVLELNLGYVFSKNHVEFTPYLKIGGSGWSGASPFMEYGIGIQISYRKNEE